MSTFRVRASSLGEVSAQLQSVVAAFDAQVSALSSHVQAVSGTSWQGEDQEAFAAEFLRWQETAEMVRLSLTALSAQLLAAEGSYTQTESGVQSGMAERRQSNTAVTERVSEVAESVDTGRDRARAGTAVAGGSATLGGAVPARSGQGQQAGVASVAESAPEQRGASDG